MQGLILSSIRATYTLIHPLESADWFQSAEMFYRQLHFLVKWKASTNDAISCERFLGL